jgi:hypothetical protein
VHRDRARGYVLAFLIGLSSTALAKAPSPGLGRVDFPVRCNAAAQKAFTRGISALHSFWYEEALAQMRAAETADPKCSMAFAGEAFANIKLLWLYDDVEAAQKAMAKMPGEPTTDKEQAWVAAIRALTGAGEIWTRRQGFAKAMREMHARWPDDLEVTAFDSVAELVEQDEPDLAHRARATALAQEVLAKNPAHPGALHYAIHATDTPDLAPLGLAAARRYAQTAPEAFHARHMPAHIFARLGLWPEALAACETAWDVSTKWVQSAKVEASERDFHSLSWIVAIQTELGRNADAEKALSTFADGARTGAAHVKGYYAYTVRQYLEATGDWKRADDLLAPVAADATMPAAPAGAACHAAGATDGLSNAYFLVEAATIRAEAAAAAHDLAATKKALSVLADARKLAEPKMKERFGAVPYARHLKKVALHDEALLAQAKNDDVTFAARYKDICALEDQEDPAEGADEGGGSHEVRADALLRLKRYAEAADEYAASLKFHPGHGASKRGLERARGSAQK